MKVHSVVGSGGVRLHVREWGKAQAPAILFIHGWSQNHLCWCKQTASDLAEAFRLVAFDLRGHGMSEAPLQADQYTQAEHWADDVAVIVDRLELARPTLVGWSYGGFIICDYVRKHGQGNIAAINLVGAAVVLGSQAFGSLIGPGFLENAPGACQSDVPTSIAAMRRFLRACLATPIAPDDFETLLACNIIVRPEVRAFLTQRELDYAPVLAGLTVPVLVTQGRADSIVLPTMADYILRHGTTAQASWYDGVGHAPFLEEPVRFNGELRRLVEMAWRKPGAARERSAVKGYSARS